MSDDALPADSPHQSGFLACPACAGPCAPDVHVCGFCGNHLATARCPGCSALHFSGSKLCTRCGLNLRPTALGDVTDKPCPRCKKSLFVSYFGSHSVHDCGSCGGVFVASDTLERLLRERDRLPALPPFSLAERPVPEATVRYVACPLCGTLMNRTNFGRRSGVIVDVCRAHGTWFDAGELVSVIEFVAQGGLVRSAELDKEEQRERERAAKVAAAAERPVSSVEQLPDGPGFLEISYDVLSLFWKIVRAVLR